MPSCNNSNNIKEHEHLILYKNEYKWSDEELEELKKIEPATKSPYWDENWNEIEITSIDIEYTPLVLSIKIHKDNPIKIETMRLIENTDLAYAFHQAVIESADKYVEFLLNVYGAKCFKFGNTYNSILSFLVQANNATIVEIVCKYLCQQKLQFVLNFEYLVRNEKTGVSYTRSVLLEALENGSLECIRTLLRYGAVLSSDKRTNTIEFWQQIISNLHSCTNTEKMLISLITVLKNVYKLPNKNKLIELLNGLIRNPETDSTNYDRIKDYIYYLLDVDEFRSLKHLSRNIVRNTRIQNKFNIVVCSCEKQFFF